MSTSNLARSLLSLLAVQGLDEGDSLSAAPGQRTAQTRDGEPVVTFILDGVAARLGSDETLLHGLASSDDLINFDAVLGCSEKEVALWLTGGRFLTVPARRLAQRIDRDTLVEATLTDLRRRNAALQAELGRHAALKVSQRLAALILDVHDQGGGDTVSLRQSDLADLMSVRRASVSTACTELCAAGALRLRRGAIQIADVEALRETATVPHSTVTDLARLRG